MPLEPLVDKWRSFNWYVDEIDGHDMEAIIHAIEKSKAVLVDQHAIMTHLGA